MDFKYYFNNKFYNSSTKFFTEIYDNLRNYYENYDYVNFKEEDYKEYEQIIDYNYPNRNIMWKYIKKPKKILTISVAFYKKNANQYKNGLSFEKYEYGLISFFISFIFLCCKNNFTYNLRFYINENVKKTLYFIIETIIEYIKYYSEYGGLSGKFFGKDWGIQYSLYNLIEVHRSKLSNNKIDKIFDNIEVFQYSFKIPKLINDNRSIGMFMRLLPLFDDRSINENNNNLYHFCDQIVVCDIDSHFRVRRENFLKLLIDEKINFGYTSRVGYEYTIHNKCDKKRHPFIYPIINLFIYQNNIKLPYDIFLKFYNNNLTLLKEPDNSPRLDKLKKCGIKKYLDMVMMKYLQINIFYKIIYIILM